MSTAELYYGLPEEQWELLLIEAENLLRDEELGSHLVGIYPAGNRIYGLESEPPGILCLYIDSIDTLINPIKSNFASPYVFYYGQASSPIMMMDLFEWAGKILNRQQTVSDLFAGVIPFKQDILYQDDSILGIIEEMRLFQEQYKFYSPSRNSMLPKHPDFGKQLLQNRTKFILMSTGQFYPCVNPKWGKVYNLPQNTTPEDILQLDQQFRNFTLQRNKTLSCENLMKLSSWYTEQIDQIKIANKDIVCCPKAAGAAIANLYRFQL